MGESSILLKGIQPEELKRTALLLETLHSMEMHEEKERLLMHNERVLDALKKHPKITNIINKLDVYAKVCLLQLIAIGQLDQVVGNDDSVWDDREAVKQFINTLKCLDSFYLPLGGIVGYHYTLCQKLVQKDEINCDYSIPPFFELNIPKDKYEAQQKGIESMSEFAEIYVLGGAADRLHFTDPLTGEHLPAAFLPFQGRSLLEELIRDLQAKEYLYYKLYGKQQRTPLVMMTSEKLHEKIEAFCKDRQGFGRPPELIKYTTQPLVPLISSDGDWCIESPLHLHLRPGGHGVIWKLAEDQGVFDWLLQKNRKYLLIRQINNPLSGIDGGLFAFAGTGWKKKKEFGFISCDRLPGAKEGINALLSCCEGNKKRFAVTNVEYTNLPPKLALNDMQGQSYLANTNILFAEIAALRKAVLKNPFPGLIVNMKTIVETPKGEVHAGRVESLMQNIADAILSKPMPLNSLPNAEDLPSFIIRYPRNKAIAVTKKEYKEEEGLLETPPGAYYAILGNYYTLFKEHCRIDILKAGTEEEYVENRWGFLAYLHPALGPQFDIIAQKIREGKIAEGSTLELEIAELDLLNLDLKGSLSIIADSPLGSQDSRGELQYSHSGGKCTLRNVVIRNQGIDKAKTVPWKKRLNFKEKLEIILQGNGEFHASNVTFTGNHQFIVPQGHRMKVTEEKGGLKVALQEISTPSWWWDYSFGSDNEIVIRKMAQA